MSDPTTNETSGGDRALPALPVPRTGEDGKLACDQQFFLALARSGKGIWNRWRDKNPGIVVTFESVDFSESDNAVIDFSDFKFGDHANFQASQFPGRAPQQDETKFVGATFGDSANLSGATFGDGVDLSGVTFGNRANLSGATFGVAANLCAATFGDGANLTGAIFGNGVNLFGATFGDKADLSRVIFGDYADLSGVNFGDKTKLSGAKFGDVADLSGTSIGDRTDLSHTIFRGEAKLRGWSRDEWQQQISALLAGSVPMQSWSQERKQQFWEARFALHRAVAGPDAFRSVYFKRAYFGGVANFSGRNFSEKCDFTGVRFNQPPRFDRCEGTGRIDLYGARITFSGKFRVPGRRFEVLGWRSNFPARKIEVPGWTADSDIAIRLRLLRKLAEDTKNHDLERDLYVEERKAERGIALAQFWRKGRAAIVWPRLLDHCLWIAVMGTYWLLADYGRSCARPAFALILSVFLFQASYIVMLKPPGDAVPNDFKNAVTAFSVANAVPFVGALTLEKEVKTMLICGGQLTCTPVPRLGFQLVTIGQSIFSAICVFFVGLALRNFFKLR